MRDDDPFGVLRVRCHHVENVRGSDGERRAGAIPANLESARLEQLREARCTLQDNVGIDGPIDSIPGFLIETIESPTRLKAIQIGALVDDFLDDVDLKHAERLRLRPFLSNEGERVVRLLVGIEAHPLVSTLLTRG